MGADLRPVALGAVCASALAIFADSIPSRAVLLVALALASLAALLRIWPALIVALLAWIWSSAHTQMVLSERVTSPYVVTTQCTVRGLVKNTPYGLRFICDTEAGPRLSVSWRAPRVAQLGDGDRCMFKLQVRPPVGVSSPGAFDRERYAAQHRLAGFASVRGGSCTPRKSVSLGRFRAQLSSRVRRHFASDSFAARVIPALVVGDRRFLEDADWELLRNTGTSHLLAISGLHISAIALTGFLSIRWLPVAQVRYRNRNGWLCGLALASVYATLAGWSLPTQRAWVMTAVICGACARQRDTDPWQSLSLAALLVLICDPLALLGASFFLSFLAVTALLLGLRGYARGAWWRAQWAIFVLLIPCSLLLFGQVSLIGPFVNLVAIPFVALGLLPMTLLGAVADVAPLLQLAGYGFALLHDMLNLAARFQPLLLREPTLGQTLLASVLALSCVLPASVVPRVSLLLPALLLVATLRQTTPAGLEIHAIDVGQGLAVLIRSRDYNLLYDTGPATEGWSAAQAILLPYFRAIGMRELDALVISHEDSDHAGGTEVVQRAFPRARVVRGSHSTPPCTTGTGWQGGAMHFEVLHPARKLPYLGNDSSCVIRARWLDHTILLPGDVSTAAEPRLFDHAEQLTLLFAPHHGSASSSGDAFVRSFPAEWVVFAAGAFNRWNMPDPRIVARYRANGSQPVNLADCGTTVWKIADDGTIDIQSHRLKRARWWRTRADCGR